MRTRRFDGSQLFNDFSEVRRAHTTDKDETSAKLELKVVKDDFADLRRAYDHLKHSKETYGGEILRRIGVRPTIEHFISSRHAEFIVRENPFTYDH